MAQTILLIAIILLELYESIRHPISTCLITQYDFQLSDLLHCQPSAGGRQRLPWPILDAKRDLQVRRSRDLRTRARELVPLCLRRSPSENYGFRRFNLIQKFRIGGTISLPRYPHNIMS